MKILKLLFSHLKEHVRRMPIVDRSSGGLLLLLLQKCTKKISQILGVVLGNPQSYATVLRMCISFSQGGAQTKVKRIWRTYDSNVRCSAQSIVFPATSSNYCSVGVADNRDNGRYANRK